MHPRFRTRALFAAIGCFSLASLASGQVVINEFVNDDSGTDDREFVELFNSGAVSIDISGWTLGGRDQPGLNAVTVIPGALGSNTTVLAPGAYYVIGNTGVANVNQVAASGFLENAGETIELRNDAFATGALVDALVYGGNRGPTAAAASSYGVLPGDVAANVGTPIWGDHQGVDVAGTPLRTLTAAARYIDGRDTNNNGRDFGTRPATPGAANYSGSFMTAYSAPNVDAQAHGSAVAGHTGSFVGLRAIDTSVVDPINPNAIPAAPFSSKANIAWDGSGGGNTVVSNDLFNGAASFDIMAYIDTNDLPVSVNAATPPVSFRSTENTMYGLLGNNAAFASLADISGQVGVGTLDSANGATGLAWYYEKVGVGLTGAPVSEKLYLVDANDGGNANSASTLGPLDWTVLATIDLSTTSSGWYRLSINVDAAGNGVAMFDNQVFNFTTAANLVGSFYASYRENTQAGADGTPDYLRPATFAPIPEPTSLALLAAGSLLTVRRRRH